MIYVPVDINKIAKKYHTYLCENAIYLMKILMEIYHVYLAPQDIPINLLISITMYILNY